MLRLVHLDGHAPGVSRIHQPVSIVLQAVDFTLVCEQAVGF